MINIKNILSQISQIKIKEVLKKLGNFLQGKNLSIVLLVVVIAGMTLMQYVIKPGQVSVNKASKVVIDFVDKEVFGGVATTKISGDIADESGLYKMELDLGTQKVTTYVSKDAKLFFPQGIELSPKPAITTAAADTTDQPTETPEQACVAATKITEPIFEPFVVSYCPYGLQMQRILVEVVKQIPDLKNSIKIRYIGAIENGKITSMHGDKEAQENLRQICIREEQPAKFFNYLGCLMTKDEFANCLASTAVNVSQLNSCMQDVKRGLAFAQKDFTLQAQYGATGSPTLILNGQKASEYSFGGRTADAVKQLVCCGYTDKPGFCSKALSTEQANTGINAAYSGTAAASGSCQ